MFSIQGTWHNQYGSEIQLEIDPGGRLHGVMVVGEGPADLRSFPLVGFVRGDCLAFVVDFGRYGSMTAWSGHLISEAGEHRLETLWHMTMLVPHPEKAEDRWRSIASGADVFRPGPRPPGSRHKDGRRMPSRPLWLD